MHWFIRFTIVLFSLIFLYFLVWFLVPKILPPQRIVNSEISGIVLRRQIWEGEVRVAGDTVFASGATVKINPGTVVTIQSKKDKQNLDLLPYHLKSGINTGLHSFGVNTNEPFWDELNKIQLHFSSLEAIGTKEQPIIFKSDEVLSSPYDINVISIKKGVLSNAKLSSYRRFEIGKDVTIRESLFSEAGECAVCISYGDPTVINNEFRSSLRESIWIKGASPRITDNLFINTNGAGIRIDPKRVGTPIITHNNFEMPENDALVILTGAEIEPGVVSYNRFSGSSYIRVACDSQIKFSQNSILSLIYFNDIGCGRTYVFGSNYWGVNSVKTIFMERFLNKDANFDISIPYILNSPPYEVGRRS